MSDRKDPKDLKDFPEMPNNLKEAINDMLLFEAFLKIQEIKVLSGEEINEINSKAKSET